MKKYALDVVKDLIDGKLPWADTKEIMSSQKDVDRFEKVKEIMQDRVEWDEKILLPLGIHLYIVAKGNEKIVKCSCGHEFGDYRKNWKESALIYVRDTEEKLEEIYPGPTKCNTEWMELREFYCPGCGIMLDVEAMPPGYPIVFKFEPDLEAMGL